jgi:uroporphyrinogen-III synthase
MPATVLVTASAGTFPGLIEALRAIPVGVEEVPLMTFAPPLDWRPVDAAVRDLGRYAAVAFTSPRSARAFAERVAVLGGAGTGLSGAAAATEIWAAGAGTAQALGDALGEVRRPDEREVGKRGAAAALASALPAALLAAGASGPVLFPCGDIRRDELPSRLRDDGIPVEEVVCYRSVLAGESEARRAAERVQIVVVASPSVADLLARACPPGGRPALLAVGPTTAAAARSLGWPPAGVAERPTTEALLAGVRALMLALRDA